MATEAVSLRAFVPNPEAPEYFVRAWESVDAENFWRQSNGKAGFAEWAVWAVWGIETLTGQVNYVRKGSSMSTTPDIDDAVRTAHGSVNWDGCANYVIDESEDVGFGVMLHACGPEDLAELFEAVQTGYRLAASIVGAETTEGIRTP